MTIYDAAMAIVVVLGMVRGAWRGFTWQVASITSLILGYTTAHSMSGRVASYLPGEPEVQRMLAMAIIYIAVSGGIFGIAWMIRGTLRKLKFEAYDRHLGTLLGGLEAVGVGMLATMFVVSIAPKTRQPIFSSPTGRVVGTVMNNLGPVLPVEVRKVLAPHWDGKFSTDEAVAQHSEATGAAELSAATLPAPMRPGRGPHPSFRPCLPSSLCREEKRPIGCADRPTPACCPHGMDPSMHLHPRARPWAGLSARGGRRSSGRWPTAWTPIPLRRPRVCVNL